MDMGTNEIITITLSDGMKGNTHRDSPITIYIIGEEMGAV